MRRSESRRSRPHFEVEEEKKRRPFLCRVKTGRYGRKPSNLYQEREANANNRHMMPAMMTKKPDKEKSRNQKPAGLLACLEDEVPMGISWFDSKLCGFIPNSPNNYS